jgi:hypothetical protein
VRIALSPTNSNTALPLSPQAGLSGNSFLAILSSTSEGETAGQNAAESQGADNSSGDPQLTAAPESETGSLVASGAQAIAGLSSANRLLGRLQDSLLAAAAGNIGVSTSVLLNDKVAAKAQKSNTQENALSTKSESSAVLNGELPKATISAANLIISSTVLPLDQTGSSGNTILQNSSQAGSSAPGGSQVAGVDFSVIENGEPWRGVLADITASAVTIPGSVVGPLAQDGPPISAAPANAKAGSDLSGDLSSQQNGSIEGRSAGTSLGNAAVQAGSAAALAALEKTPTLKGPSAPATPSASMDGKSAAAMDSKSAPGNQTSNSASAAEQVSILPIGLPTVGTSASNLNENQASSNGIQKSAPGALGSGNPLTANKPDAATGNAASNSGGFGDGSSQGGQNAQSSQVAQIDPSHPADVAPRVADNGAFQAQVQAVPAQAVSADSATAHRTSDGPELPSLPGDHQDNPASIHSDSGEAVGSSSINTAKLLQTMSESEMHVGMRSTEFGDISIRTSVSQQQMVTQITLDHSDLSQAISAHVSTMQAKLGEDYGLHASIEVHNLGSALSGDPGHSSQGEQRASTHSTRFNSTPFQPEEDAGLSLAPLAIAGSGNRLDIRA